MTNNVQMLRFSNLTNDQIKLISEMFSRTFQHDPQMSYLIPNLLERQCVSHYIWEFMIRCGMLYGEVYGISPNLKGISILMHSEKDSMTTWGKFRTGYYSLRYKLNKEIISRIEYLSQYVIFLRKSHAHFKHWYLFLIGIDPEFYGKGYAHILIDGMLARIEQDYLPCYLATCNLKNIDFYEKYGFKLLEDSLLHSSNLHLYAMLRDIHSSI